MEFLVAGASAAVQIGTATFADPTAAERVVDRLPGLVRELGTGSVVEVIGTLRSNRG